MEPAGLYRFAIGVLVGAFRRWWWARWGLGFGPGLRDWSTVFVSEGDPVDLIGIAGNSELASVMMRTQ